MVVGRDRGDGLGPRRDPALIDRESLALRIGLPLVGATLGYLATDGASSSDIPAGAGGALVGLVLGIAGASTIDIGALAGADAAPQLAPAVTASAHGATTFGLTGSF